MLISKIMCYINARISKILAAGLEPATIKLYFCDFLLSALPHYEFMISFDFSPTSAKPNY